ncbi:MAG: DNA translocase FtsK 4TM domain-containing protein [Duodenibacillus sp.]|nr:DNA translocase FtsK 4TM domain-containing protein [Duodenibacillus sp.]
MKTSKKPAIASEWRKNKKDKDQADIEKAREEKRRSRREMVAAVNGFFQKYVPLIGFVVSAVLSVLLAVALITYTPVDPGFSVTGTTTPENYCGLMGAWLADLLYWSFGYSAWWIELGLIVFCCQCLRVLTARRDELSVRLRIVSTFFGLILLMCSSVGLEALQFGQMASHLPLGGGGLCGQLIALTVAPYLGIVGTTIVFFVVLAVGSAVFFHFSWLNVAEAIGFCFEQLCKSIAKFFAQRREQRELRVKEPKLAPVPKAPAVLPSPVSIQEPVQQDVPEPEQSEVQEPVRPIADPVAVVDVDESATEDKVSDGSTVLPESSARIKPGTQLLNAPPDDRGGITPETIELTSRLIESKLRTYRIKAEVKGAQAGPVITQYWIELAEGVKGSQVEDVRKDLTRALAVHSVRVVPVIPNKPYMGLEIPNGVAQRMAVYLKEVLESEAFANSKSLLSLALGKDIAGDAVVVDLARMPHLLVGGTTGSGKSVAINTMILSLLYKCDPSQLRLVLIDPKTVEFSLYQDIPHLLCPVVTDMNKAANALDWLVVEMDRRYALMSKLGVRSFDSFNDKVRKAQDNGEPIMDPFDVTPEEPLPHVPLAPMPYIVCFIDELADLILVNRKQVEMQIMRLAQKARAAGIHLVLATQRPSADIVTPLIKANIVARICFQVASRFDSQVVLDEVGAQDLLGRGDMLCKLPSKTATMRVQGCMVEENEILAVVDELKSLGQPEYVDAVTEKETGTGQAGDVGGKSGEGDPLYDEALQLLLEENRVSISFLQRRFSIGYNRAANLIESMEAAGAVSKPNAAGKRVILVPGHGRQGEIL